MPRRHFALVSHADAGAAPYACLLPRVAPAMLMRGASADEQALRVRASAIYADFAVIISLSMPCHFRHYYFLFTRHFIFAAMPLLSDYCRHCFHCAIAAIFSLLPLRHAAAYAFACR